MTAASVLLSRRLVLRLLRALEKEIDVCQQRRGVDSDDRCDAPAEYVFVDTEPYRSGLRLATEEELRAPGADGGHLLCRDCATARYLIKDYALEDFPPGTKYQRWIVTPWDNAEPAALVRELRARLKKRS